jgi:serine/threonine protein kinase
MRELLLERSTVDGRYYVLRRLRFGSYSEIFLAIDKFHVPSSPHHQVVVKALNPDLKDDAESSLERTLIENFQNEALCLDRVRHPNVVSRLGHGTSRDRDGYLFHYIVLEYMVGGDLHSEIRRNPPDRVRMLSYLEQVCSALEHAHGLGVIHRDIKPQNILLTEDRKVAKLTDFGVARRSALLAPITRVGSDIYAPPEHSPFSSSSTDAENLIGPESDIYSLAKTAYTMLTGTQPRAFAGRQITELPASIAASRSGAELLAVIKRATSNDPKLRYSSVSEFWTAFLAAFGSEDDDVETVITRRYVPPRAVPSRGYNPLPPKSPGFRDIKLPNVAAGSVRGGDPISPEGGAAPANAGDQRSSSGKGGRAVKTRSIAFILTLGILAGGVYITAPLVKEFFQIPGLISSFFSPYAIAASDVYLRSTPNTDNPPIGIVTKKSRLRILDVQDRWYQVEIIQQGRKVPNAPEGTRGWVNGKYLEL